MVDVQITCPKCNADAGYIYTRLGNLYEIINGFYFCNNCWGIDCVCWDSC